MNSNKSSHRLPNPIRQGLASALVDVFSKGFFADQVVEYYFRNQRKWGSRDRRNFAENLFDVVRWLRPLVKVVGWKWNEEWNDGPSLTSRFSALTNVSTQQWLEVIEAWESLKNEVHENGFWPHENDWSLKHSISDFLLGHFNLDIQQIDEKNLFCLNQ
ncbi:MAG: hypothetical protein KDD22_02980, partial [Bdellovibrionales bacterium]|nr:hypothetical protein [Bdellovibrionales bacterium]